MKLLQQNCSYFLFIIIFELKLGIFLNSFTLGYLYIKVKELTGQWGHKLKDLQFTILKVRTAHSGQRTYNLVGRPWVNKNHPAQLRGLLFMYTLSGNRIRKNTPETCVCAASLQQYWIKSCTSPVNTSRTIVSVCKQDNVPHLLKTSIFVTCVTVIQTVEVCFWNSSLLIRIFNVLHVYRE